MGLFDLIDAVDRRKRRKEEKEEKKAYKELEQEELNKTVKGKGAVIFKVLTYVSVLGFFIAMGLLVLTLAGLMGFARTSTMVGVVGIIAVFCVGCLLSLPWIKYLLKKEKKVLSIVFLSFVGVCTILWILSIIIVVQIYQKSGEFSATKLANLLNIVKASLIITIQFSFANMITSTILKYTKRWIPFQIILYISNLFIDVWLSMLIFGISPSSSDGIVINSDLLSIVFSRLMLTLLAIAFVYMITANALMGRSLRKRTLMQNAKLMDELDDEQTNSQAKPQEQESPKPAEKTPQERLTNLKTMLEQGLITQEEYDKKKQAIIDEM